MKAKTAEELGVADPELFIREVLHIDGPTSKRGEIKVVCMFHDDHNPSMEVNQYSGLFRCYSCGARGGLVNLTAKILGIRRTKALSLLTPDSPSALRAATHSRLSGSLKALEGLGVSGLRFQPSVPSWGHWEAPERNLLAARGFTSATLRRWGVRWVHREALKKPDGETFAITNSIAIPITDKTGEVLCWCFRATEDSERWQREGARYLYTPGVEVSSLLFGLLHHAEADEVALTEGALDAMYLDQCGIPALAVLGSQAWSGRNISFLSRYRSITIVADDDRAGRTMAADLGEALVEQGVGVTVCRWRPWFLGRKGERAKDVNDLINPLDVEILSETAVPWATFMMHEKPA